MRSTLPRLLLRASRPKFGGHSALARPPFARSTFQRHASTATEAPATSSRLVNFFYGSTLLLGLGIIFVYVTDTRASVHRYVVIPALRFVYRDPEDAHHAGNHMLKTLWDIGLHPRERNDLDSAKDLQVEVFGHTLRNPIATSAGIDKHADIPDPLFAIGPAIIEIGGTTPVPQPGNPKPRVFRLTSQNALINRYGLNSEGADHVAMRLRNRVRKFAHSLGLGHDEIAERAVLDGMAGVPPGSLTPGKLLAINIAKNKTTPEDDVDAVTRDYVYCVDKLGPYADILVVNVSSPNTPGLRSLQQSDKLQKILSGVVKAANSVQRTERPKVMVKVSPDEDSEAQISGICEAVWASGVDGVIVGNTTNQRPEPLPHLHAFSPLEQQHLLETGGFSGPHLFDRTVSLVKKYRKLLTEKPVDVQPLEHKRSALEADAERIKAAIENNTISAPAESTDPVINSIETGKVPAPTPAAQEAPEKEPLIKIPTEHFYDETQTEQEKLKNNEDPNAATEQKTKDEKAQLRAIQDALERLPPRSERDAKDEGDVQAHLDSNDQAKVIFATGGISNGQQALEVLNAGADVAMVYTALVYGGVGTISRIKDEMREEMRRQANEKRALTDKEK